MLSVSIICSLSSVKKTIKFKSGPQKKLIVAEETLKAAEVRPVQVCGHQYILVAQNSIPGHASLTNDGVIQAKIEQSRHLNILYEVAGGAVLLVHSEVAVAMHLPVEFLFKLVHAGQIPHEFVEVYSEALLVHRVQVVEISSQQLLELESHSPVHPAPVNVFDVL